MSSVTVRVSGMHCDSCAERLHKLLAKEPGVREATVSFAEGQATIAYNPRAVAEARLLQVVEQAGFAAERDGS